MTANDSHTPQPSTGKLVFLDYDQAGLDAVYNQSAYAPHSEHVRTRMSLASKAVRDRIGPPQRHAYGDAPIEGLDVYPAAERNAPIIVFIHGGAWRRGLASQNAFAAEMFVKAGAHFIVPDFSWVQDAADSLRTLADQVRRSLIWVYRNAGKLDADRSRIYLVGHSSGAHLAAVALTTDWKKDYDATLPENFIRGAVLCSGMYDLHPVRLSSRSSYVKFDDDLEFKLSPQRHLERIGAPVVLLYGTRETPEFQRQSIDFDKALRDSGKSSRLVVAEEYDHFELKETLANPYGPYGQAVMSQVFP